MNTVAVIHFWTIYIFQNVKTNRIIRVNIQSAVSLHHLHYGRHYDSQLARIGDDMSKVIPRLKRKKNDTMDLLHQSGPTLELKAFNNALACK